MISPRELLVTPTGQYVHLSSPWLAPEQRGACDRAPHARALRWDESDQRPVCPTCLAVWHDHVDTRHRWALEMLSEIEHDGVDAWRGIRLTQEDEHDE